MSLIDKHSLNEFIAFQRYSETPDTLNSVQKTEILRLEWGMDKPIEDIEQVGGFIFRKGAYGDNCEGVTDSGITLRPKDYEYTYAYTLEKNRIQTRVFWIRVNDEKFETDIKGVKGELSLKWKNEERIATLTYQWPEKPPQVRKFKQLPSPTCFDEHYPPEVY